ncbi:hypothetical protein DWUX_1875 [Desulfovibrio diazotrophicus]|nr:hypothetical protein DWUX_1875 [Desulfovibrio diazotrophicus]
MPCGHGGLVFVWRLGRLRRGQGAKGGAAPPLRPPTPPITPRFSGQPHHVRRGWGAPLARPRPLCRAQQPQAPQPPYFAGSRVRRLSCPRRFSAHLSSVVALCWLGGRVTVSGAAGVCRCATTPLYAALNASEIPHSCAVSMLDGFGKPLWRGKLFFAVRVRPVRFCGGMKFFEGDGGRGGKGGLLFTKVPPSPHKTLFNASEIPHSCAVSILDGSASPCGARNIFFAVRVRPVPFCGGMKFFEGDGGRGGKGGLLSTKVPPSPHKTFSYNSGGSS